MDINISANTLFHFTSEKKSLLSILKNGLYVRYSLENYESLIYEDAAIVFPMTSFCDIPLSQVKRHTKIYGQYAIGLTKEWGMKNKINPVIYTYPNSTTAGILSELSNDLANFFDIEEEKPKKKSKRKNEFLNYDEMTETREYKLSEKIIELQYKLSDFIRYIKPYSGRFYRNNKYLENPVKFYEEREWRFTPSKKFLDSLPNIKDSYKPEYYTNLIKRRAINIKLASHIKLNFEPKDIRFIIVKNDNEIPEILDKLDSIFNKAISSYELKLLGTRLISLEQILENL